MNATASLLCLFENFDKFWDKTVERKLHLIILQDELPVILTATMTLETHIKGEHVYKDRHTCCEQGNILDTCQKW